MKIWGFILLAVHLFSWEEPVTSPVFISLGSHCEVAVLLKVNELRKSAYPLDHFVTLDHEGLMAALDEDFVCFFNRDYLFSHPLHTHIPENSRYKIELRHEDWILQDADRWAEVTESFNRRLARFREIRKFPGKVVFIRAAYDFPLCGPTYWLKEGHLGIDRDEALQLKEALDRYFPGVDFLLVIVNYEEDQLPKIEGIEGVDEYKIRKSHRMDDYQNMFMFLVSGFENP